MRIEEYLALEKITFAEFADRLDVSKEAVRLYLNGRIPKSRVVARIYRETQGQVCPNDLYDLHPPRAGQANGGAAARP